MIHFFLGVQMLLKYLATPRYEGPEVDQVMAGDDARALYKAGEKRLGTDEKTFIRIFCERSRAHLAAISEAYMRLYEKPLEKVNLLMNLVWYQLS